MNTPQINISKRKLSLRDCGSYFDIWQDEYCVVKYLDKETAEFIVRACNNHEALMDALIKIAAFTDTSASEFLGRTGSYSCFDEPGSVKIARAAIANAEKE